MAKIFLNQTLATVMNLYSGCCLGGHLSMVGRLIDIDDGCSKE